MTTINKAMNLGFEDHSVTLVAAGRRILINEWTLTGRTVTADQCRAIARLFDKAAGMAEEPIREDDDESKATCDDCGRDFRESELLPYRWPPLMLCSPCAERRYSEIGSE